MIKKTLVALAAGIVLVGTGALVGTVSSGASTSWVNELTSKANTELGQAGYAKKEELVNSDITAEMAAVVDPKIAEEEAKLTAMLEEYYALKIQGLQDSSEFAALELQIETIRQNIFARYQKEIDAVFVAQ